ncbi:hypothetical protein VNO77_03011 [Canavalia gladiata]|uniref:Uncharacterized protein n=1 Tax=Canavalia gladiata TaxID=3824 RepID=A0AAN9MYZ2_CANGL
MVDCNQLEVRQQEFVKIREEILEQPDQCSILKFSTQMPLVRATPGLCQSTRRASFSRQSQDRSGVSKLQPTTQKRAGSVLVHTRLILYGSNIPGQRTSCRHSIPMNIVNGTWREESESHRKRESPFRSHILAMPQKSTLSLAMIGSTRTRWPLTFACKEQGSCMALMLVGTYVLRQVMTAFDINSRASCIA